MKNELSKDWFLRLASVDTPTVCNALELALGRRQATGFTYGTPIAAPRPLPSMVGYARTSQIRAAEPSSLSPEETAALRLEYYRYVAPREGEPVIVVQQDVDPMPGLGSFWGEVNSTVHHALGVKGVVTNGSVRDLDMLAPDFPIVAGSIGPSHAHVHVLDFDVPVRVLGMQVQPGDLIHADRHGAVVIPGEVALEMPRCIELMMAKEAPILAAARKPGFSVEDIAAALREAADIH
ncbi:RraA family protein [Achromobacter sp. NPDC058515]|uniref:RraA family protein n=1 Tax=Achromobacter sp. NPDC058515 TaxID=3346533 RepID=UPI003659CCB2